MQRDSAVGMFQNGTDLVDEMPLRISSDEQHFSGCPHRSDRGTAKMKAARWSISIPPGGFARLRGAGSWPSKGQP